MRQLTLSFCFLLLLTSCQAQTKPADANDLAPFIQHKGDSLYKAANLPGLYVGIIDGGQRQYFSFGYANKESRQAFDSTTLFEIGSITKTFTAYIIEKVLHEKGIPDTASIITYVPDSVKSNQALKSISFLSLLNHTSGLPRLPGNMKLSMNDRAPYDNYTKQDLYAYLKLAVPKPDGKSSYSNLGVGLAGVLAQQIAGRDYSTLVQEYILQPFGISTNRQPATQQPKAQGYFMEDKVAFWKMNALAPAGGLKCSSDEMLSYLQYMSYPKAPEARAIIDKLLQPTVSINSNLHVGRGWHMLEAKDKPTIYWHNGGTYGFSTFAAFTKEGKAVIVVANRFNANATSDGLGMAVMRKMLE